MKKLFQLLIIIFFTSCEKDQNEINIDLNNVMNILIENNNAHADNFEKIKIIAEFPENFNTEDDMKVEFQIMKETVIISKEPIRLINQNGSLLKRAEIYVSHNKNENIDVKAIITINNVEIVKSTFITFKKAYLNNININTSSLVITPNSFNTIQLTSELIRNNGVVTLNSIAETVVKDNSGNPIGSFLNYKNSTNQDGKIINNFTLGNSNYTGILYAITTSIDELGTIKKDSLIINSN